MTSCRFSRWRISAILNFRGPIMGSLKSPCRTSYRSSTETKALNCLIFLENHILVYSLRILATDNRTDRQTDGQAHCIKPPSLSRAAAYNHGIMRVPSSGSPGNLVFLTNCHILGPMGTTQARTPKEGGGYNGEKPYIITRYISETLEEDIVTMES